jgi:hypothetical protein
MRAMLDEATVEEFEVALRGELISPGDEGYDEARKAYNAMIDKYPRMIVRCADVADVISSVNFVWIRQARSPPARAPPVGAERLALASARPAFWLDGGHKLRPAGSPRSLFRGKAPSYPLREP